MASNEEPLHDRGLRFARGHAEWTEQSARAGGSSAGAVRSLDDERSEIWIISLSAKAFSPKPLIKIPLAVNGREFNRLFSPRFSPDGDSVFFLVPFASTTNAIIRRSTVTSDLHFVSGALNFRVVEKGRYSGFLAARVRKAKMAPGYYEWYWLLSSDGQEIGLIGETEGDVDLFVDGQKEEPKGKEP